METTITKQTYEAPKLTVVSFKVEQGFTGSGPFSALIFWNFLDPTQQVEDYSTANGWEENSDTFWN